MRVAARVGGRVRCVPASVAASRERAPLPKPTAAVPHSGGHGFATDEAARAVGRRLRDAFRSDSDARGVFVFAGGVPVVLCCSSAPDA